MGMILRHGSPKIIQRICQIRLMILGLPFLVSFSMDQLLVTKLDYDTAS